MKSLKEDKRPATLWYWNDWFSSFDVRACSLAARGLWMDMLGIMFGADVRGTLVINGKQVDGKTLAKISGSNEAEISALLSELKINSVYSELSDGTIINRRMYDEGMLSKKRSMSGKLGADSRWQTNGKDDGKPMAPPMANLEDEDNLTLKSIRKELRINVEDQRLVQLLIDLILQNNSESSIIKKLTEKRQLDWITACRLMRERDEKTEEQIEAVIRWSQADSFWKTNILSMPKLREQWDQLWMKMRRKTGADNLDGIKAWLKEIEGKNELKK